MAPIDDDEEEGTAPVQPVVLAVRGEQVAPAVRATSLPAVAPAEVSTEQSAQARAAAAAQEAAVLGMAVAAPPPREDQASPRRPCPLLVMVYRVLGIRGERRLNVKYSLTFKMLAFAMFCAACYWAVHFFVRVLPESSKTSHSPCRFSDDQLRQNTIVLFAYFACFSIVRALTFLPGIAVRVADIMTGGQGAMCMYCLHMVMQGPLYIFSIASVLFGVQLLMSPKCEGAASTEELHETLALFAGYSCILCMLSLLFVYLQSRALVQALRVQHVESRRAPPGTVENLPTVPYSPELFGDEEGKAYPAECPICLQEWEQGEEIKITYCGHAFHKECIGHWIQTERTCAFCRQDVTIMAPSPRRLQAARIAAQVLGRPADEDRVGLGPPAPENTGGEDAVVPTEHEAAEGHDSDAPASDVQVAGDRLQGHGAEPIYVTSV